jgi:membrane associated rhomboid family serine protease
MEEKANFLESIYYPLIFLTVIWGIKFAEILTGLNLGILGIFPRQVSGLAGIIFAPVLHGSLFHLFSNSGPVLILGTTLFYFYRDVALRVILVSWLITGLSVWLAGREAYHIGASGLIYTIASFLFFSGFIRRSIELIAISFIVVFLYGGMVWGIFPLREGVSWESHLTGAAAGTLHWHSPTGITVPREKNTTGNMRMNMEEGNDTGGINDKGGSNEEQTTRITE